MNNIRILEPHDDVFGFRPLRKSGKTTVVIALPIGLKQILSKLNKDLESIDSVHYIMDAINKRADNKNLIYFRYITGDEVYERPNEIILSTHKISKYRSNTGYMPIPLYYRNYLDMNHEKEEIYAFCIDNFGTYADQVPRLYLKKCNRDIVNLEEIEEGLPKE